jgi:hypothetical protein
MFYLFAIIIEINVLLLFFLLAYLLLFRRFTFYTLNRYYFLFSIVCSTLLPWLIPVSNRNQDPITKRIFMGIDSIKIISPASDPYIQGKYLIYAFYFVCALMLCRLIIMLFSVWHMHARSVCESFEGITYRRVKGSIPPFNFWRSIYVNPDQHNKDDLKNILLHEKVHVQQFHTIDTLLAELVTIISWFNPAVWKLKAALKLNLEYVTDQTVLKQGVNAKNYQYSLLSVYCGTKNLKMVSNFSSASFKKRMIRMNKESSKKLLLASYVLIVPFALSAIFVNRSVSNNLRPIAASAGNENSKTKSRSPQTATFLINNQVVSKSQADKLDPKTITRISVIKSSVNDSVFIFTNGN